MSRRSPAPMLVAVLRVDEVPPEGREVLVKGEQEQLAAIAELLQVSELVSLQAQLRALRFRGGVRVTGRVKAELVQSSVVTLEPVRQVLDEALDRVFLPGHEEPYTGTPGAEVFVNLEGDDSPDRFEGSEIDLTNFIIESVALAIDPYPREPGARVEIGTTDDDPEPSSPFAVLKALKGGPGES